MIIQELFNAAFSSVNIFPTLLLLLILTYWIFDCFSKNLAKNVVADDNSIGIRVVEDEFCQRLTARLKKPIVSTSANISGKPSPKNFDDISDDIKDSVDHIVNWRQEETTTQVSSSIIKLGVGGEIEIIRE